MTKENSCAQIRIITRITAIACLASMLLCYKLWLGERNFPAVPLFHLPILHHPLDYILPCIAGILLLCIAIVRNPQKLIIGFVTAALLLALTDMNRWQPWFYQYVLMFFILCFFNYRCDDTRRQEAIVSTFKLMVAAVYFWSGLQKLNPHFLSDTFPWLMEPITNHMAEGGINKLSFLGYMFPLLEIGTGVCLLIPALQKPAVIASTIMHLFILFVLSPLGHNYNPVVWPWNVAMVAFVFVLFYNEAPFGFTAIRNAFSYHSLKIVILLFVMMPLFNFFNLWDSYLSHNLYSGNTSNGLVYVSDSVEKQLPDYLKPYAIGELNQNQITIKYWCMKELGVPAYPEKRNFVAIARTIYAYTNDPKQVYFMYIPKLKFNEKDPE
ncbi:MAG: hypothetical protein JWO09_821 [Bacteroidetes bacterium]|nr:hypothetical protein [Bacteroidota bacterium]